MSPELAFVDAEVAEVSEYRVTENDITVGRVSPSTVKGQDFGNNRICIE